MSTVLREGWLDKKGHINTNLKRRWVVIQKTGFLVYYEEVDGSLRHRGTANLSRFSVQDDGPLEFVIDTPDDKKHTSFSFKAYSNAERDEWISVLRTLQSTGASDSLLRTGFLSKLGAIHKAWRKRWIVLSPSELKYFKKDTDGKPAGVLKLFRYNSVSRASLAEVDKTFSFKIYNTERPKQRIFYFSAETENEIDAWMRIVKTCVEGINLKVEVVLYKNDPIQLVTATYRPTITVQEFLNDVCSHAIPPEPSEHYQLLYGPSCVVCDTTVRMDLYGPVEFKVVARKGHIKRKEPPPGIKRIVQEAIAEHAKEKEEREKEEMKEKKKEEEERDIKDEEERNDKENEERNDKENDPHTMNELQQELNEQQNLNGPESEHNDQFLLEQR